MANLDFKDKVKTWWDEMQSDQISNIWSFQKNLKALKSKIKKWNKEEFGNIFWEKRLLEIRLHEIQTIGINEGYSPALLEEERLVETQLEEREKQEELLWWHKSRIKWLQEGEKNTKLFHNMVIQNRQRSKICKLRRSKGNQIESRREIEKELVHHFKEIMTED